MRTVNILEAKTHLSRLLRDVEAGEEVQIARAGRPVARLTRLADSRRVLGGFAGQVTWDADAFAPLSDAEAELWTDSPLMPDESGVEDSGPDTRGARGSR